MLSKAKVNEKTETVSSSTVSKSTTKASTKKSTSVITNAMFDDLFTGTEFMTEGGGING